MDTVWPSIIAGTAVAVLGGGFVAIAGGLLRRAMSADAIKLDLSIAGVRERVDRVEKKVDEIPHELAKVHARVSDTNERVAAVEGQCRECRTDGRGGGKGR